MATIDRNQLSAAQRGSLLADVLAAPRAAAVLAADGGRKPMLDGGDRLAIVDTLIAVLSGAYCHLVQKRAGYAVDPVQALQLLRLRATSMSETAFHLAVTSIISGLRDAHTRYSGPRSLKGRVTVLPFLVEQYGPVDAPRFLVSKVSDRRLISDRRFRAGVELVSWNGIPFARAVDLHAERETGGRPDARLARAIETLTVRPLELGPPPDEMWVIVGYLDGQTVREIRMPWRVIAPEAGPSGHQAGSRASRLMALDRTGELRRRARKLLYCGELWAAESERSAQARAAGWLRTSMPDVLSARRIQIGGQEYGHLRVWTFDVDDDDAFLAEVIRLVERLPQEGLIIDLRGNPGGLIWAAERMLQLFTPAAIAPTRFSLLATPMTRAMARSPFNRLELEAWATSLEAALSTGDSYSQPLPITDPSWCNDIGQRYSGPALCVVDANTYSSGDLFSAGFADNNIGPVICIGEATGAGGANVWTSNDIRDALAETDFALDALPDGVAYSIAIRRATRSGLSDGLPIEDIGVQGIPYAMTRDDLLHDNRDLLAFCSSQFKGTEATRLQATRSGSSLTVVTRGLDLLEVYADSSPVSAAIPISDGRHRIDVPTQATVDVVGRVRGEIRQRRRLLIA
jgi:hypothetical protein